MFIKRITHPTLEWRGYRFPYILTQKTVTCGGPSLTTNFQAPEPDLFGIAIKLQRLETEIARCRLGIERHDISSDVIEIKLGGAKKDIQSLWHTMERALQNAFCLHVQ